MCLVPLSEGGGIDLDNGGFGKGVGTDEFVVGGVVGHDDDTDFAGDSFGAPGEIAGIEAESTKLLVAAASTNEMNALGSNTCVCWLSTLLEGSVLVLGKFHMTSSVI